MVQTARYGGLSAVAVAALLLHCGNSSFEGADDSSSSDAAPDGTSSDVANGGDGATIDSGPADSAFVFDDPCASGTAHTFCCDFDEDGGLGGCPAAPQTHQGAVTLASTFATSLPFSLHSAASGDAGYAYAEQTLAGSAEATCTFDLYINTLNGLGHNIFAISVNGDPNQGIVSVLDPEADGGAARLRLFGPMVSGPGFTNGQLELPFRQWVRVQMDLSLPSVGTVSGTAASLSFDGGAPLQITTNIVTISTFRLAVGFDFVGTGNADAFIDDLACDMR